MPGITPCAPTAEAVVTRKTDPRKRYISMPPWSQSALSCAKASPAPELSFTPTTVPSPASAAIVCGSTTVLTVTGMLYTHNGTPDCSWM